MSPEEVLQKLIKMGVKTSRSTLLRYEKAELIPAPERGSTGRGVGRFSDYPDNTAECFFASWWLMKMESISIDEMSKILPIGRKGRSYTRNELIDVIDKKIDQAEINHNYLLESCDYLTADERIKSRKLFELWQNYYWEAGRDFVKIIEEKDFYKKSTEKLLEQNEILKLEIKRLNKIISINPV